MSTAQNFQRPASTSAPWDKLYSTYWWEIVLDGSHPRNHPDGLQLTGYSKKQGHDEAKDKEHLLLRRILALASQGYIERSICIKFHWRPGTLINKSTDPLMFTLHKKGFALEPNFLKPKYQRLQKFLTDLYDALENKRPIDNLLPKSRASFSKDEFLDINRLFFRSRQQLDEYCAKLIRNGHPFDAVKNFHTKYLEKKPLPDASA